MVAGPLAYQASPGMNRAEGGVRPSAERRASRFSGEATAITPSPESIPSLAKGASQDELVFRRVEEERMLGRRTGIPGTNVLHSSLQSVARALAEALCDHRNSEMRLVNRVAELTAVDGLLASARERRSGALVLRGEPGIGLTTLLSYAAESAVGMRVLRSPGVESEAKLPFSALHRLCKPLLAGREGLPERQRGALDAAFGVAPAPLPADRFLVALATLWLLDGAAAERPLLCLFDDAERFDEASGARARVRGAQARQRRHRDALRRPLADGGARAIRGRAGAPRRRTVG